MSLINITIEEISTNILPSRSKNLEDVDIHIEVEKKNEVHFHIHFDSTVLSDININ
jgi:hypothetical protein